MDENKQDLLIKDKSLLFNQGYHEGVMLSWFVQER
jgi:hypothetical protein